MPHARVAFSRRRFLEGLSATAVLSTLGPLQRTAYAVTEPADREPRALVVVQLAGGLDAHDVIVPFENDDYHRLRPTLALGPSNLITLESRVTLNRACAAFEPLWKDGTLSILPNVGFPQNTLSHFRSSELWHTASGSEEVLASGWLGRAAQRLETSAYPVTCFHGTQNAPRIFARDAASKPSRTMSPSVPLTSSAGPGKTALAEIAARAGATRNTEFYFVSIPGFDTHCAQRKTHSHLLRETTAALAAFQQRLEERGVAGRVLTFVFSEFGRTLAENHQGGTDHCAATAAFLLGQDTRAHSGLVNSSASPMSPPRIPGAIVDFRSVYAAILRDWLRLPAAAILPSTRRTLGSIRDLRAG